MPLSRVIVPPDGKTLYRQIREAYDANDSEKICDDVKASVCCFNADYSGLLIYLQIDETGSEANYMYSKEANSISIPRKCIVFLVKGNIHVAGESHNRGGIGYGIREEEEIQVDAETTIVIIQ